MADRSKVSILNLAVSASNVFDSVPIPDGKLLVMRRFGCADDGATNGKAATYRLQFGTVGSFTDVRLAATNGSTQEFAVNKEFLGDGVKFFRVTTTNASSVSARVAAWWIEAYDK